MPSPKNAPSTTSQTGQLEEPLPHQSTLHFQTHGNASSSTWNSIPPPVPIDSQTLAHSIVEAVPKPASYGDAHRMFSEFEKDVGGELLVRQKKSLGCGTSWKPQWFRLSGEFLVSFPSHNSRKVMTCITFASVTAIDNCTAPNNPGTFRVRYVTDGLGRSPGDCKELLLRCPEPRQTNFWVELIRQKQAQAAQLQFLVPLKVARENIAQLVRQWNQDLNDFSNVVTQHVAEEFQKEFNKSQQKWDHQSEQCVVVKRDAGAKPEVLTLESSDATRFPSASPEVLTLESSDAKRVPSASVALARVLQLWFASRVRHRMQHFVQALRLQSISAASQGAPPPAPEAFLKDPEGNVRSIGDITGGIRIVAVAVASSQRRAVQNAFLAMRRSNSTKPWPGWISAVCDAERGQNLQRATAVGQCLKQFLRTKSVSNKVFAWCSLRCHALEQQACSNRQTLALRHLETACCAYLRRALRTWRNYDRSHGSPRLRVSCFLVPLRNVQRTVIRRAFTTLRLHAASYSRDVSADSFSKTERASTALKSAFDQQQGQEQADVGLRTEQVSPKQNATVQQQRVAYLPDIPSSIEPALLKELSPQRTSGVGASQSHGQDAKLGLEILSSVHEVPAPWEPGLLAKDLEFAERWRKAYERIFNDEEDDFDRSTLGSEGQALQDDSLEGDQEASWSPGSSGSGSDRIQEMLDDIRSQVLAVRRGEAAKVQSAAKKRDIVPNRPGSLRNAGLDPEKFALVRDGDYEYVVSKVPRLSLPSVPPASQKAK